MKVWKIVGPKTLSMNFPYRKYPATRSRSDIINEIISAFE